MLAVAGGDENLEAVQLLISKSDIEKTDSAGNNLFHIAVIYGSNKILEFLLKIRVKLNLFERNNNGETVLSIAQEKKNDLALKLLEQYKNQYDKTKD